MAKWTAWTNTSLSWRSRSPPPRNNQSSSMPNMNHGMGAPDMFNPMMAMNGPNMMSYQQQMQMQQFLMQQQQQQQQMARNQQMQPGIRQPGQLPPESQPPPAGYVCYKCNQPGTPSTKWIWTSFPLDTLLIYYLLVLRSLDLLLSQCSQGSTCTS